MSALAQSPPAAAAPPAAGAARLGALDGLRGIAALGVVFYHTHTLGLIPGVMVRGYLFVDLFFLLSGFVMTLSFEDRLRGGALSPTQFLRLRIRRLWPVLAAGALVGAATSAGFGYEGRALFLLPLALLLVPDFSGTEPQLYPLNPPHWSLLAELIANAAQAIALSRLSNRALALIAAACGAWLGLATWQGGANTFGPDLDDWPTVLARIGVSYVIGMLIARAWRQGTIRPAAGAIWWLPTAGAMLAVALLPLIPLAIAAGDLVTVLVLFPLLFVAVLRTRCPPELATPMRWLGLVSYPLYAVHLPILMLYAAGPWRVWPAWTGIVLALAVASALAAWLEIRATGRRRS